MSQKEEIKNKALTLKLCTTLHDFLPLNMIYDSASPLFRSFLISGGSSNKCGAASTCQRD